mgnify:CR=1 FL=1
MNDFKVTLQVKNGKLDVSAEDDSRISMKELAETCEILYLLIGDICMRNGADLESVKDAFLELHQKTMLRLMERWDNGDTWDE